MCSYCLDMFVFVSVFFCFVVPALYLFQLVDMPFCVSVCVSVFVSCMLLFVVVCFFVRCCVWSLRCCVCHEVVVLGCGCFFFNVSVFVCVVGCCMCIVVRFIYFVILCLFCL